jgi:hypothetical protein
MFTLKNVSGAFLFKPAVGILSLFHSCSVFSCGDDKRWVKTSRTTEASSQRIMRMSNGLMNLVRSRRCLDSILLTTSCSSLHLDR